MYKSKFNLLFEEIIKTTIGIDTFDYEFNQDDDKLTCKFEMLNEKEELVTVIANISLTDNITFTLDNGKVKTELSEKEFMLKYYKNYDKFKEAYKEYKKEIANKEKETKLLDGELSTTKDNVPQVVSFNSKLKSDKPNEKTIRSGITNFIFKQIKDDIKNLIQVNFELVDNNDNSIKYDVIGLIKLLHENSVPIKFILNSDTEKTELSPLDFKTQYPKIYNEFLLALNKFENANN